MKVPLATSESYEQCRDSTGHTHRDDHTMEERRGEEWGQWKNDPLAFAKIYIYISKGKRLNIPLLPTTLLWEMQVNQLPITLKSTRQIPFLLYIAFLIIAIVNYICDYTYFSVIWYYNPINVNGTNWIIMAQIAYLSSQFILHTEYD